MSYSEITANVNAIQSRLVDVEKCMQSRNDDLKAFIME